MSAVATAIAGGAIVGGLISASGAQSAAGEEAGAANAANAMNMSMFNTEEANEQPYLQAGNTALGEINSNMPSWNQPFTTADFESNSNPAYGFDLSQGEQAVENSAAASGHLISSNELGNASNYAQNMALNDYQSAFNNYETQINNSYSRLAGVAQLGQAAAANTNSAAMNTANNLSANTVGAGNAAAAGTVGTANAISGAVGTASNGLLMNSLLNNGGTTSTTSSAPSINFSQGASAGINNAFQQPGMQLQQPAVGQSSTVQSLF